MRYLVNVAGRTVEVDLRGDRPRVDGIELGASLQGIPGTRLRHLLVDHASHALLAEPGAGKGRWTITVAGRALEVEALDERTRAIQEMGGGAEVEADRVITAPMPGLVVRLLVEVGQAVSAGQGVVVVEAMKMENELKATGEGTVARIEVAAGQPVEKGATLIILE